MNAYLKEQLTFCLKKMSDYFTGNEFYRECRNIGISDSLLNNGSAKKFLEKYCERISHRTYRKLNAASSVTSQPIVQEQSINNESKMIEFLKSKGYKIMKSKTEWTEI